MYRQSSGQVRLLAFTLVGFIVGFTMGSNFQLQPRTDYKPSVNKTR